MFHGAVQPSRLSIVSGTTEPKRLTVNLRIVGLTLLGIKYNDRLAIGCRRVAGLFRAWNAIRTPYLNSCCIGWRSTSVLVLAGSSCSSVIARILLRGGGGFTLPRLNNYNVMTGGIGHRSKFFSADSILSTFWNGLLVARFPISERVLVQHPTYRSKS